MNLTETTRVLAAVRLLWPHSNLGDDPQAVIRMWHSFLSDLDYRRVDSAIRELAAQGREFAPAVGLVVKTVADRIVDSPDFDEVMDEVHRLLKRYHPAYPGREKPPAEAFSHPSVAAFARDAWRELALGPAPGTNNYGTFYAQQREAYKALAARHQRGVALAAVGAPRRRSDLNRPDFLAALPRPSEALLAGKGEAA